MLRLIYVFLVLMLVAFSTIYGWIRHAFSSSCNDHDMLDCPHATAIARRFVGE